MASDNLPALEVADHVKEKEFAIGRIITIFNNGMQRKWDRRYYIDLFAGPGKCVIKNSDEEVDGSPILAVKSKVKFTDYFFSDGNSECLRALKGRIGNSGSSELGSVNYYLGNADSIVDKLISNLPEPKASLGLAVFDPWGWDFTFETLITLTANRRLDLVINFPTSFIKRNWKRELPQLDKFMNGGGYRKSFESAMSRQDSGATPTSALLDYYKKELHGIGYKYVRDQVGVKNSQGLPLYQLIFASKNERGADFWNKVTGRQESGQVRMEI